MFRLQEYRQLLEAGSVPRCGRVLDIPPPEAPPAEEAVIAVQQDVATKQLEKAVARKVFDMNEMINAGLALKNAEDRLQTVTQKIAEYPSLHATWASQPQTRVCGGLVKSSIVFFGEPEQLPNAAELAGANLLIILGTSL